MNIWLKTSRSRSSGVYNTSLPTITEHRHRYAETDSEDQDQDHMTVDSNPYFSELKRDPYQRYNKLDLTGTENTIQEDQEWSMLESKKGKATLTSSKKSVSFNIEGNTSERRSNNKYENDEGSQSGSVSEQPTHYIINNDPNMKFKNIKKHVDSTIPRNTSSNEQKEENNTFSFRGRSTSEESKMISNKKIEQNQKSSSRNNYSIVPQTSGFRFKKLQNENIQTNSHVTMTSRSINSMAANYTHRREEEDSTLLRSRRDSVGKTTGRRQMIKEHVIGLIEYCSNEVGLAIYNTSNGQIHLCQIIERLTYFRTISTIERFYPLEILYSSSLESTPLIQKLLEKFRNVSFKPLKRVLFDETKGYFIYSKRSNKNSYNPDNKFIAYSALYALMQHLQNSCECKFNYDSLNIRWHLIEDLLIIESQTILELQVFMNGETRNRKDCFVEQFRCLTQGGNRMLRANLLQPLANGKMIKERQNLVAILLQDRTLYDILVAEVGKFKNFQIITAKFIQCPKEKNMKSLKLYISAIFSLSKMCLLLQKFNQRVETYKEKSLPLIQKLFSLLNNPKITDLHEYINDNFDEENLKSFEGGKTAKKENFIFLFKAEKLEDEFIEIQRITYTHTTEDILRIFKGIKEKSGCELKLMFSDIRGYYLKGPKNLNLSALSEKIQDDILQITEKKDSVLFNTNIILSLNNRLKQSQKKLILSCEKLLFDIVFEIQKNMDVLFEINFEISVIDMVLSFVQFVKHYQGITFCQPEIEDGDGALIVEGLKTVWTNEYKFKISNPIDLAIDQGKKVVVIEKKANSYEQLNLLYSIGYLTMLTQIGCYVPASRFSTNLFSTLLSKINLNENIQSNLSHFQLELYHFKNIIDNVGSNNNCLVLLDELVKGTQYEEELGLSMGITEQLINMGVKTFVLVSDQFQLNLMKKISKVPAILGLEGQPDQQMIDQIKAVKKRDEKIQSPIESPFHFIACNNQTSIESTLKQLNFSTEFLSSFRSLVVNERQNST